MTVEQLGVLVTALEREAKNVYSMDYDHPAYHVLMGLASAVRTVISAAVDSEAPTP